jgi:protein O-mannosyl-transferase
MTSNGSAIDEASALSSHRKVFWAGGVIIALALAAYYNSLSGPFILDDRFAITDNPTIRQLGSALSPPASSTAGGRPVLNLTFALNYALGGTNVWGYHAFNLLIHTLAGLTLFGIVRRTLLERPTSSTKLPRSKSNQSLHQIRRAIFQGLSPAEATPLALAVAAIWIVHPVQTEAVTYISERAESLMGLFYLLTLYCFVRGVERRSQESGIRHQAPEVGNQEKEFITQNPPAILPLSSGLTPDASRLWFFASILACLLGAMSKEIIVTAPVIVLLYDRTFVAGSFRAAWRLRWRYYLGLACTWLLLARLMTGLGHRSVGFDQGVTWWSYALTSCRSVILYCKLALWPHPLIFDHGLNVIRHATEALPYALVLAALLAGTAIALWRRPAIGFLGAWFFVILAPASSIVPVAGQPMAEHRMYLSLAAVIAFVVLGLHRLIGRRGLIVYAALTVGLGWLSVQRNEVYQSELAIWNDTVAKCPDNPRAHYNLGCTLEKDPDRIPEAMAAYEAALRIKPDFAEAHNNLGNDLLKTPGRLNDAMAHFQTALSIKPDFADAHSNLGTALFDMPGHLPEAIAQYEMAVQLDPDSAGARDNLGTALLKMPGRLSDAIAQFEAALQINPDYVEAHNNLGSALLKMPGRLSDAIAQCEAALRLKPDYAQAHNNLGSALSQISGRLPAAMAEYKTALRLMPDYAEAHYNLGLVFFQLDQFTDAIGEYELAIKFKPDYAEAHNNLGNAMAESGRLPEAIAQYEQALQINPDYVNARKDLELVRNIMKQQATGSEK